MLGFATLLQQNCVPCLYDSVAPLHCTNVPKHIASKDHYIMHLLPPARRPKREVIIIFQVTIGCFSSYRSLQITAVTKTDVNMGGAAVFLLQELEFKV